MNNFIYTVLNADIPVLYIGVSGHIHVNCVIRHSVNSAVCYHINAYIMVSALLRVMCVIKHSVVRAV